MIQPQQQYRTSMTLPVAWSASSTVLDATGSPVLKPACSLPTTDPADSTSGQIGRMTQPMETIDIDLAGPKRL